MSPCRNQLIVTSIRAEATNWRSTGSTRGSAKQSCGWQDSSTFKVDTWRDVS